MDKKKFVLATVLLTIIMTLTISAASVTKSRTKVQGGYSVTARFVFDTYSGLYVGKSNHTFNYLPQNTNQYAYYIFYHSQLISVDQTTATQNFEPSRYNNETKKTEILSHISITESY